MSFADAKIVLVGVDPDFVGVIVAFLEMAFEFLNFEFEDSIENLKHKRNIQLFIINTDSVKFDIPDFMEKLAEIPEFDNIPKLGLAHKKHIGKMPFDVRFHFHDLLLMPAGCEDLLNRIDIWIKTFEVLNEHAAENYCPMN